MDKILIVDDDEFTLEFLKNIFKDSNFNVVLNNNPNNVLAILNNHHFDAIILDIQMPDIDGISLCKQIKTNKAFENIPIFFLTSHTDTKNLQKCFGCGGVDFLKKPFDKEDLLIRLEVRIKFFKNYQKMIENYEKNLHDLEILNKELKSNTLNSINEKYFEDKEHFFQRNDKLIGNSFSLSESISENLTRFDTIIENQKKLVENTKDFLYKRGKNKLNKYLKG